MKIEYKPSLDGWVGYDAFLDGLITTHGLRRICEVGGGANPAIPAGRVATLGLDYLIADIDPTELAKAPSGYRTTVLDITAPGAATAAGLEGSADLVFSRMLAEHVGDARSFHDNCFQLLRPGGLAFHFFPTLYALPFVINRLLPERMAYSILNSVLPGRERSGRHAKFPAHYHWCRGPTRRQLGRYESIGFEVAHFIGFYGHGSYYQKVAPLKAMHELGARWLLRHPVPALTSYGYAVLRKPSART